MEIPSIPGLPSRVVAVLLVLATALSGGTILRGAALLREPTEERRKRWRSLATWWLLLLVLAGMLVTGRPGVMVVVTVLSLMVLRELRALVAAAGGRRPGVAAAALVALVGPWFVVAVAFLPAPPSGLEGSGSIRVGWEGWLLTLLVLTELNDIAQAWWGRSFGAHPMAPTLSPGKSWEGFWGGLATTVLGAVILAPTLTPVGRIPPAGLETPLPAWSWSAALGVLVAVTGVAGDLTASYLKRTAGVKDSSDLLAEGEILPAHGGVLDRLDSLSLSAPLYYLFAFALWGRAW